MAGFLLDLLSTALPTAKPPSLLDARGIRKGASVHLGTLRDGRKIEYYIWPPEDDHRPGIPIRSRPGVSNIVAFHDMPGSGKSVGPIAQMVCDRDSSAMANVRIIAPSRPGFGRSEITETALEGIKGLGCCSAAGCSSGMEDGYGPTFVQHGVKDTVQLINTLGLGDFSLMGFSGGAPYSLAVAEKLQGDPRLRNVVVIAGVWTAQGNHGMEATMSRSVVGCQMQSWSLPAATRLQMKDGMPLQCDKDCLDEYCRYGELGPIMADTFEQGALPMAAELRATFVNTAPVANLALILTPVHIFHGTDDKTCPVRQAEDMKAGLPNATLHIKEGPGAGHMSIAVHHGSEAFKAATYSIQTSGQ